MLVPKLGLVRAPMLFGVINVAVALWTTQVLRASLRGRRTLQGACVVALLRPGRRHGLGEHDPRTRVRSNLYADEVVLARTTPYQRIVLTAWKDDLRLFLNSNLQFSSRDEYRYHEALVHPGLAALPEARRVLILGGGDGLALREVLRYPDDSEQSRWSISIPEMTRLFSTHTELRRLNRRFARPTPRVQVVNADAFVWLSSPNDLFDFAVVDFPDPVELLARQAVHDHVLPDAARSGSRPAPRSWCRRRRRCSPGRRTGASSRRSNRRGSRRRPITCTCRRSASGGSCSRRAREAPPATRAACGVAVPDARFDARAVRVPDRHEPRARRAEPAEHAGARALLRETSGAQSTGDADLAAYASCPRRSSGLRARRAAADRRRLRPRIAGRRPSPARSAAGSRRRAKTRACRS